jgi:hypothetical protein
VWATLKGTQQTFPNHTAISGSTSQLLFSVRTSSTQNVGQAVLIPVEVDLNTPLSNMPDPSKQVWFQGILSGMKADGTIVLTTADEVPAPAPHPLSPQQLALIRSRIPPSIPAPGVLDFVYNNDTKAGNCHIHPGNRFEISAGPNGIDLHFTAQMSTDFTISGDIFHLTFEFYDNNGNLILSSPEIDFPQNGAMYMNRGPTNIDYKTTIGPVAQPANLLQQIKSADYSGRC